MSPRRVLVLGANGNIGTEIAHGLAGPDVVLTLAARDVSRLEALGEELRDACAEVIVAPVDVCDDLALEEVVRRAAGQDGLTVAVNNVGSGHRPAPLDRLPVEEIDRVLAVNLRAVVVAMKYELELLVDGGSLVNVASSAGTAGAPGMSAYAAAKHGVVGLTRTAAIDHGPRGVRANAVAPGPIDSGGLSRQPDEVRHQVGQYLPMKRIGRAAEVAAAVVWLASPASGFVTGAVLSVDGGKHAGL